MPKIDLLRAIKRLEDLFFDPTATYRKLVGEVKYTEQCQKYNISHSSTSTLSYGFYMGGPKWGKIAKATRKLIQVLGEEINIDKLIALLNAVENLHHNNAIFFDKFVRPNKIITGYNKFNSSKEDFLSYIEVSGMQVDIKKDDKYIIPDVKQIAKLTF